MAPRITIVVDKPEVPPGMVLLEEAGSLSSGLYDSLARLIQRQLGFPWRAKLRNEAKRLTRVALTGVDSGSGVLCYDVLPTPGINGRNPSIIAALDLVSGIKSYVESHRWPAYLPPVVRNRIGAAVAPALTSHSDLVAIAVEDDGLAARCEISFNVKDAMQIPEEYAPDQSVEVVGNIVELDKRYFSFKMEAASRIVSVELNEWQFNKVDSELRWERVFVEGFPRDRKGRTVHNVTILRAATDEEEDHFSLTSEIRRGEMTETYRRTRERADELLMLDEGWDSYKARSPGKRTMAFALHFLRDAIGVLMDHGIIVPAPFLVPTSTGGVQIEWHVGTRELELEIPEKGRFEYLAVDGSIEKEGEASRWTAMRLVRWVITGESV